MGEQWVCTKLWFHQYLWELIFKDLMQSAVSKILNLWTMNLSIQFTICIINQLANKIQKKLYSTNVDESMVPGTSKTPIISELFVVMPCAALDTQKKDYI